MITMPHTNLKPVSFISAGSWSTTAHFVVDAPSTGIVCLETLTATVGWNMYSNSLVPRSRSLGMKLALTVDRTRIGAH